MHDFHFTFDNLERQYKSALEYGYSFITCKEYYDAIKPINAKTIVNRIDVDFSLKKARRLVELFNNIGLKGSFFIRLHAPEYNPFSFESYKIIKLMIQTGHEIGYHSEIIDQAAIWGEDSRKCLIRDIKTFETMYNIKLYGVASHGGMTGLNNLDFWKEHTPEEFGLDYEAYDKDRGLDLFDKSFYISDSEWTRWKCYDKGIRRNGDHRTFEEHLKDGHKLIYLLIHSDTYFDHHFYE